MVLNKIFFYLGLIICLNTSAQTIPVGNETNEDAMRRLQIIGISKDNSSFTVRPMIQNEFSDSELEVHRFNLPTGKQFTFLKKKTVIKILPFDWIQQYNSKTPFIENDAAMIPAVGYQTLFSAGVYLKCGILSIQLKPELIWSQNKDFKTFSTNFNDTIWASYFGNLKYGIDAPEKFNNNSYKKIFPGQSNIKITAGKISMSISTENLWWGPGIKNSLLMSNAAPGFLHLSLNTDKPISTGIGSFEGQIIGGKLLSSGIEDSIRTVKGTLFYSPKPSDWRYLSAMILAWQPKWIKHVYLGFERSIYEYSENLNSSRSGKGILKYIPVLQGFFGNGHSLGYDYQDQLSSLFVRWVLPKSKAEFYFEWARNDRSQFLRDFLLEPEHSRAFIIGGQKVFALQQKHSYIQISAEITQLQEPNTYIFRAEPTFYVHFQIINGYTNQGQYLGAGIGPGSNSQSFDISLIKPKLKLGVKLERLVHNNDLYYRALVNEGFTHQWVDMSTMFHGHYQYRNYLFFGEMGFVNSPYYEWGMPSTSNTVSKNQVFNMHSKIGLSLIL
jgi:hypothetical protein